MKCNLLSHSQQESIRYATLLAQRSGVIHRELYSDLQLCRLRFHYLCLLFTVVVYDISWHFNAVCHRVSGSDVAVVCKQPRDVIR